MSELYTILAAACAGGTSALRLRTRLAPAGGYGDKIFPPTYAADGKVPYARETRHVEGKEEEVVLLDSVQSQANRMEQALKKAWEEGRISLPVVQAEIPGYGKLTSLDVPHRIADAIFRDCMLNGKNFLDSPEGTAFAEARLQNARPLYISCPTALVFGMWHSQGKAGGLGCKFARALVSEVVGYGVRLGERTSSRIDPLGISSKVEIFETAAGDWAVDPNEAVQEKKVAKKYGKKGKASEINHGNVAPTIDRVQDGKNGGVSISGAMQTTVLSFPQLRRLSFPVGGKSSREADVAGRTVLAALALVAVVLGQEEGFDLRSRCLLVAQGEDEFEVIGARGDIQKVVVSADQAVATLKEAVAAAEKLGLTWRSEPLTLVPAKKLVDLVKRSNDIQATGNEEG